MQVFVTNWGSFVLLQIRANVITNWGSFIITNWGKIYYKLGEVPQIRAIITNLDITWSYFRIKSLTDFTYCSYTFPILPPKFYLLMIPLKKHYKEQENFKILLGYSICCPFFCKSGKLL